MPLNLASRRRAVFLLGFLACAGLLGYAYYAQFVQGLEPCPLCILQRVGFAVMGVFFLAGALHDPRAAGYRWYAVPVLLGGLFGAAVAGRHVWLQSLPPDRVPACGPDLEYLLSAFPLTEALSMVFEGSGSCAVVDWQFLGLSMPAWTLIWYVALMLAVLLSVLPAARALRHA